MIKYKASVNIASVGINILSIAVFIYIYYSTKDEWVLLPVFFFASVLIFEVKKILKENDRDNFLNTIDSIEIYKGNFNEIAILKKK